jgi:multisubunit Na+/H+ antiporter MnhB subunit
MRRSLILDVVVRAEFHALLVVALYLLFAGHNQPGGGFAGGLVAGAAITLRFVSAGPEVVRRLIRVAPTTLLGVGLMASLTAAAVPLLRGRSLLDHGKVTVSAPLLGEAKLTSTLVFDAGVFLVVVGLVAFLLEAFADPLDEPVEPQDLARPDVDPRPDQADGSTQRGRS